MAEKLAPCCARVQSRKTQAEDDLRGIARRLAAAEQRHTVQVPKLHERLQAARAVVQSTRQAVIDHEADHADDVVDEAGDADRLRDFGPSMSGPVYAP